MSLTTGSRTAIVDGAMDARYAPTGHLVYLRLGRLEAVPFDSGRVAVTGEAVGLLPDVMQALNAGSGYVDTGAGQFSFSNNGTLVYVAGGILADRHSDASGRNEVYVQRFPELGGRQQMSRDGGRAPVWRRDGRELFYVTEGTPRKMMAVDIRPAADLMAGQAAGAL